MGGAEEIWRIHLSLRKGRPQMNPLVVQNATHVKFIGNSPIYNAFAEMYVIAEPQNGPYGFRVETDQNVTARGHPGE